MTPGSAPAGPSEGEGARSIPIGACGCAQEGPRTKKWVLLSPPAPRPASPRRGDHGRAGSSGSGVAGGQRRAAGAPRAAAGARGPGPGGGDARRGSGGPGTHAGGQRRRRPEQCAPPPPAPPSRTEHGPSRERGRRRQL